MAEERTEDELRGHVYRSDKPAIRRACDRLELLLSEPPVLLLKWLEKEGFSGDVPRRLSGRNTIYRRLMRKGMWEGAQRWMSRCRLEIHSWGYVTITKTVVSELLWRLVEAKVFEMGIEHESQVEDAKLGGGVVVEKIEGMEYLPEFMRWALMHPGLAYEKQEISASLRAICDEFEALNPCPSQAARNAFVNYRGDKKAIDSLLKESAKLYSQWKRQGGPNGGALLESDGDEDPMEGEIANLLGMGD